MTGAALCVVPLLLGAGLPGATEDGGRPPVRLTLREAVERARAHSARLAQLSALETASRAGLDGARAGRMPQLEVSVGYSRLSEVPELSLVTPGTPPTRLTVFPNIPDTYRAHAGLTLPLYTGGRVPSSIASAEEKRAAAGREVEAGAQDLVLETTSAFWDLVTAGEAARVLEESLASFESHLKDAQNRFDLGMVARSDVLSVQVERDRAELQRLQARNALAIASEDLVRLVGLEPGARVEPVTEPAVPEPAVPDSPVADAETLVAAALASRPELLALRSRAKAAEAAVQVARAPGFPQVGLQAGYDYARPNTRVLPLVDDWKDSWSVGVSVSMTPFDGGRTSAATAQARALAKAQRHEVLDLERKVRLEVRSRVFEVSTADAALRVAERALVAAREAARVEKDRYQEGVSSSSDLLDVETRLLRAGLDRTNAVAASSLARARLDRAVGR